MEEGIATSGGNDEELKKTLADYLVLLSNTDIPTDSGVSVVDILYAIIDWMDHEQGYKLWSLKNFL